MSSVQSTQTGSATQPHQARDTLRIISLVLVVIGIAVSGYLSYVKLAEVPIQCIEGEGFDCEVVQNSAYARMFGIPIAWLGLATYLVIGALILLEKRIGFLRDYGLLLTFGIVLFAFLYSVYLVYLQVAVLQALCPWCLVHEATMTLLFVVTILRLRRGLAT